MVEFLNFCQARTVSTLADCTEEWWYSSGTVEMHLSFEYYSWFLWPRETYLLDMFSVLCLCAAVLCRGWSVNITTHMKFLVVLLWLVAGWLSFLLEYTVNIHVVPDLSVHNIVASYCWHFKFFQSMILKFELLGLDDRRKSLDNSTHCLNEGVSVLCACYCLTWLDCLLWLILKHLVYPYVTEFTQ